MSLVKSREMREQEPRSESEPMLACSVCKKSTKPTELAMFGARCGHCYGDYCRAPQRRATNREFMSKPARQALANIAEAAERQSLTPGQLWVKECCEKMA